MASKFQSTVVSNEYVNAVADSAATGKPIAYSGVVASSTVFTDEQLKTLDYSGAQSANKEITSVVTSSYLKQGSNTIVIEVNLSNENLSTDFQWASVLIYATYNGKNILVAVLRLVTPELFPAYDGKSIVSVGVDLFISVDKTAAANISVNGAGYATMDTVNKLKNYVDNDFNATIIRSDKDGVLNGSYSFSKVINALAGIDGFIKVRKIPDGTTKIKDLIENFISEVSSGVFASTSYMAYNNSFSDSPFVSSYLFIRLATRGPRTYVEVFDENNNAAFTNYVSGSFLTWRMYADSATSVHNIYDENINGIKTFIKPIIAQAGVKGNLQGNADTATKLATARRIGGQPFDGTSDITLPGVNATGNQDTTGNAATAGVADSAKTANDPNALHQSGNESASGTKTFTGTLVANNPIKGNTIRYNILDGYDLNGYKDTGDFVINGANNLVNYPSGASNFASLHVEIINNGTAIQTLKTSDNIIYTRTCGGSQSTFNDWRVIDSPYRILYVPSSIGSIYSLIDLQKNIYGNSSSVKYISSNVSYSDGPNTDNNTFILTIDLLWWKDTVSNYVMIKAEEPGYIYRSYYNYKGFSGWKIQQNG